MRARGLWVGLAVLLLVLAFSSSSGILYRLLFALLAVPLVGYLGSVFSARRLAGEVRLTTPFLQVGEVLEEEITLRNLHWFPKLLLEAEHDTAPFPSSGRVLTLWPYRSSTWVHSQHCERRGLYRYGELNVTSRDPLGLFNRTMRVGDPQTALIYPATVDLSGFFVPAGQGWTEGMIRGRTYTPSAIASFVREYVPGDAVSHIHWRSTARMGKLMVKEFEREPSGPADAVWVMLDLNRRVQAGHGADSTVEYAVTIAASVARRFLSAGRTVGLMLSGRERLVIRPGTGLTQVGRALEALAVIEPGEMGTVVDVAAATASELTRNASVVIVTSAAVEDIAAAALVLEGSGAAVVPVIVDAASFEGKLPEAAVSYRLPGTALDAYVVHKGEDIQRRLDYRVHGLGHAPVAAVGEVGGVAI